MDGERKGRKEGKGECGRNEEVSGEEGWEKAARLSPGVNCFR